MRTFPRFPPPRSTPTRGATRSKSFLRQTLVVLLLAFVALSPARGEERAPGRGRAVTAALSPLSKVYVRASPAVVGIECLVSAKGGRVTYNYFGTGVLIDPTGLVLTSISVVPEGATHIVVFVRGGHKFDAKIVKTVSKKEFSLLRIKSDAEFPYLALGSSDLVRVGQIGLTLGNAFQSIKNDDQVTLASGIVSAKYTLTAVRSQAKYTGPIIETTAAVNDGMDGGPLLNANGEVIGLLSLNFSTSRWLGTAIPIDTLKPLFGEHRKHFSDWHLKTGRYIGLGVVESRRGDATWIRVETVDADGPAHRAGLVVGDRVVAFDGEDISTVAEFRGCLARLPAAEKLHLSVASRTPSKFALSADTLPGDHGVAAQEPALKREIVIGVSGRF